MVLQGEWTQFAVMFVIFLVCIQYTFASNAATIVGGCLVTNKYKLRIPAAFISAFVISVSNFKYGEEGGRKGGGGGGGKVGGLNW